MPHQHDEHMHNKPQFSKDDPADEAAASKLWGVYVGEAEKYDKSLVEGWKDDMEGILIFAGLFSASLTAFIVESYKMMLPDQGQATLILLSQISQQLAAVTNGSTSTSSQILLAEGFSPSTASLACNALWFVSLGLSLTCALFATLLEQWARDFLHRANMRSAPATRARIFSFLYFGMRRFKMHAMVEVVPLLLHTSLFFFFSGLVAFLLPINIGIAIVAAGILATVVSIYAVLTLLPLWNLDCPYRTPLSTTCWRESQRLRRFWSKSWRLGPSVFPPQTIVEAMEAQATQVSPDRDWRDYNALQWTVKTLIDDSELEPLVEALPDLIWKQYTRRYVYDDHVQKLLRSPALRLKPRLESLLRSCHTGVLAPQVSKHRQILVFEALGAICSIQEPPSHLSWRLAWDDVSWKDLLNAPHNSGGYFEPLEYSDLASYWPWDKRLSPNIDKEVLHFVPTTQAMLYWSTFCCVLSRLFGLLHPSGPGAQSGDLNIRAIRMHVGGLHWVHDFPFKRNIHDWALIVKHEPAPDPLEIDDRRRIDTRYSLIRIIDDFTRQAPFRIYLKFLSNSVFLDSPPYNWYHVRGLLIRPEAPVPFLQLQSDMEDCLSTMVFRHPAMNSDESHWLDEPIRWIYSYWPSPATVPLPSPIIVFLNLRARDASIFPLLTDSLWNAFEFTLSADPGSVTSIKDVLTALWRTTLISSQRRFRQPHFQLLPAVTRHSTLFPQITASITALLRISAAHNLRLPLDVGQAAQLFLETSAPAPAPSELAQDNDPESPPAVFNLLPISVAEVQIVAVCDYANTCASQVPPYELVATFREIMSKIQPPSGLVHSQHQLHFAASLAKLIKSEFAAELLEPLIQCSVWDVYACQEYSAENLIRWLDDPKAISGALDVLQEISRMAAANSSYWSRLEVITTNLAKSIA